MFCSFRALALLAGLAHTATACSNLLITKGASADGSNILAYTADDMGLYGSLDLRPAADHAPGSMRQMWDWFVGVLWQGSDNCLILTHPTPTILAGTASTTRAPSLRCRTPSMSWETLMRLD
jgi:hypothetical protein